MAPWQYFDHVNTLAENSNGDILKIVALLVSKFQLIIFLTIFGPNDTFKNM